VSETRTTAAASAKLRRLELAGAERRVRSALEEPTEAVDPRRRAIVIAIAAALFAATFSARLLVDDPSALIANFYTVPIALLAAELGLRAGIAAAAIAFALVVAWGLLNGVHVGLLGYVSRLAVFLMVGVLVGRYAERVKRELALRRRSAAELELRARELESSNAQLTQAVVRLEAFAEIARSVGGETDLARVLSTILDRARGVVAVRALLICLRDGDDLVVAATTGPGAGRRIPLDRGPLADALAAGGARRLAAAPGEALELAPGLSAQAAVLVPLGFRGPRLGLLAALDREDDGPLFDREDEELISALAASAATAVATAQSVARDRLRDSITAAEEARGRWARELHDETLQGLVGLRMLLSSARRSHDPAAMEAVLAEAADETRREIVNLRSLIAELRPAALDELGLGPAIETLAERSAASAGVEVLTRVTLADERLAPEIEGAVYRVVQEALTNVAKHARASHVRVEVGRENGGVDVIVEDDGHGFDPAAATSGFGLVGMRERVELTGGQLEIHSRAGETRVCAHIPSGVT
jgi:signal transduction histidine kinase